MKKTKSAIALGLCMTILGGTILGVVAAGDLCYLVLQAISANKGIYIGVEWSGIIPSYTQGLW